MKPLGLVSLQDELRPEAKQTLTSFIRAGVQPKIISGDDPETVAALAREVGVIFSSLVVGAFPLELRQGSIVTLFSVGIPTVLLVIWARPTPAPRSGQVSRLVHFILPPVVTTSVLALLLFAGMYLLHHASLGELNVLTGSGADGSSPADALAIAETTLTTFLVCTGLVLIIFVQPPTRWWVGGNPLSGDWRPTWLAIGPPPGLLDYRPGT